MSTGTPRTQSPDGQLAQPTCQAAQDAEAAMATHSMQLQQGFQQATAQAEAVAAAKMAALQQQLQLSEAKQHTLQPPAAARLPPYSSS